MSDFEKQKRLAKSLWKDAKKRAETGKFGDDFEDGKYKATIRDVVLGEAQTSGRLQIVYSFEFLEGEYLGKTKKAFKGIDKEENLARAISDINKLGIEVEDFEDLEPALEEIKKKRLVVRIILKTRGEYQDVYIDKLLTGEAAEEEGSPEDGSREEGAPSEEEGELKEGATVSFILKGEDAEGEVIEVLEDTEEARVKLCNAIYRVKAEKLTLVEEVPEEPTEEPAEEEPAEEEPVEEEPAPRKRKVVRRIVKHIKKKKR